MPDSSRFGRFRAALRGGAANPSPGFLELLRQHSLSVLDRQLRLDQLAGEGEWWISQDSGTLTVGDLVADVQFIGSESEKPHDWMWAWANENVDPPLSAAARRLGAEWEHVLELAQARYRLPRGIDGHAIATVAVGLANADAYYRAPYPGGSAFVMLRLPADRPLPAWAPLVRAGATLRAAPLALRVPLRPDDVTAYLRTLGLKPESTSNVIAVHEPEGEVAVRFDSQGRISSVDANLRAE